MALKKLKPVTPGTRHRLAPGFSDITESRPEKSLVKILKKTGGRNSEGRMTMRYIGGGHKQKLRIIDFKRDKFDIPAVVKSIEYGAENQIPRKASNLETISTHTVLPFHRANEP